MKISSLLISFVLLILIINQSMAEININTQELIEISVEQPYEITLSGINLSQNEKIYLIPKQQSAEIGVLKSNGHTLDVAIQDNIAYIADALGDFRIADIDNPSKPYEITTIKSNPMAVGVIISEDQKAYVSSYYGGVNIFDISNPGHPILLSNPKNSQGRIIRSALINLNKLCLASEKGMKIIDVTDPYSTQDVGMYSINSQTVSVIVRDSLAVLSIRDKGFDLINIEDPYSPTQIKHMDIPAMGTILLENRLFVVNENAQLLIFDLIYPQEKDDMNSLEINEINSWKTKGNAIHLDINNNMLCIAYFNGIECIDISDIYNLKQIWNYKMSSPAFRIVVKDNIAYVACYDKGLVNIALPVIINPVVIDQQKLKMTIPAIRFPGEYTLQINDLGIQKNITVKFLEKKTIKIFPDRFYFGVVKAGTFSEPFAFTITNESLETIAIHDLSITGTYKSSYTIVTDSCSNTQLNSHAECQMQIAYKPLFDGMHTVQMNIPFTEPYRFSMASIKVKLSGEGYLDETYQFERMTPPGLNYNFYDLSGITFDYKDNIFIAETKGNRILKYTQDGFLIYSWGGHGNENGKFDHPYDIKFDSYSKKYLYVADSNNNRIQRFHLDGNFNNKWDKMGTGPGEFIYPYKLAIDSFGNIYVANRLSNIQKFNNNMEHLLSWNLPSEKEITGIAIYEQNEDRFVYVLDEDENVYQYEIDGTLRHNWNGSTGIETIYNNGGIAIDPDGIIYVLDGMIQTFKPDGTKISDWGLPFCEEKNCFYRPMGIGWPKEDKKTYVCDWDQDTLFILDNNGQLQDKWSIYGEEQGQFNQPYSIAMHYENEEIYVSDYLNHRIQIFDPELNFSEVWEVYNNDSSFNFPRYVSTDNNGNIYVANYSGRNLLIFDKEKNLLNTLHEIQGYDYNENVRFYTFVPSNNEDQLIYVFENGKCCLLAISIGGELISSFGKQGTSVGEFSISDEICVDSDGFIYVLERYNSRIQKIRYDKSSKTFEFIAAWGRSGNDIGEFYQPGAMAIDSSNNLYISDRNDRIQKFDVNGNFLTQFGTKGYAPGQFFHIESILVDSNTNKIFVADSYNRIQCFNKKKWTGGKAIIVAGGGPFKDNNIWEETSAITKKAYYALTLQGFNKHTIHYETFDTDLDIDDNGIADDVDDEPSLKNLRSAITQWAKDTGELIIYLADHGGNKKFLLKGEQGFLKNGHSENCEYLSAEILDKWLKEYEENNGKVTLIYDACYSGSFIESLKSDNRLIITSTKADEEATLSGSGTISFSYYFWTYISQGLSIEESYEKAKNAMKYHPQNACIEPETNIDSKYIGNGIKINTSAPVISINDCQIDPIGYTITISGITVEDPEGIKSVWATVIPPDYKNTEFSKTIKDLPRIRFKKVHGDNDLISYEATYNELSISGRYSILVYASDVYNNISAPEPIYFNYESPIRRKVIIVTGTSFTGEQSDIITQNVNMAIDSLVFQKYAPEDIMLLSSKSSENFEIQRYDPNLKNLQDCILEKASHNTYDLIVYLIGDGIHEAFLINSEESLTPLALKNWLDEAQKDIPNGIIVIYDACQAKSFTDHLIPDNVEHRILIASTGRDTPAFFQQESGLSFSFLFWEGIKEGRSVGEAFNASESIKLHFEKQCPSLYDPYNDAYTTMIGFGIKTSSLPSSESLSITLNNDNKSATLSMKISSVLNNIQSVKAVIKTPVSQSTQTDVYCDIFLENSTSDVVTLQKVNDNIYSGISESFLYYGEYLISVYTRDTKGIIDKPVDNIKFFKNYGQDMYEPDYCSENAKVIHVNEDSYQKRTLHTQDDRDFIKFYAIKDQTYYIEIKRPDNYEGEKYEFAHIHLDKIDNAEWYFDGETHLQKWNCENSGIVFLIIDFYNMNFSQTEPYIIKVYTENKAFNDDKINKAIFGTVFDKHSGELISNAVITNKYGFSAMSEIDQNPNYYMYLPESFPKSFQIKVTANGYLPFCNLVDIQKQNIEKKNIPMVSTIQALKNLVSILKSLTCDTEYCSKPLNNQMIELDYQKDEKLTIEDAIALFKLIAN